MNDVPHQVKREQEYQPPSPFSAVQTASAPASGALQTLSANAVTLDTPLPDEKPKRTFGLKAFDVFLYPFLTNFSVFAISVGATYLTNKGHLRNAAGEPIYAFKTGKVGELAHSIGLTKAPIMEVRYGDWMNKRGIWLVDQFKKVGMGEKAADMAKMVFFSFADGSLMAPVVKKFEDNREDIAKGIDNLLGTRPADDRAYEAEPKQTWGSVLGGRLVTAGIVVPTAVALENLYLVKKYSSYYSESKNLNQIMFYDAGERLGKHIISQPEVAKWFGPHDIENISRVTFFEAFYTSVCTAGMYFSSRMFANWGESKKPGTNKHEGEYMYGSPTIAIAKAAIENLTAEDAPEKKVETKKAEHQGQIIPKELAIA